MLSWLQAKQEKEFLIGRAFQPKVNFMPYRSIPSIPSIPLTSSGVYVTFELAKKPKKNLSEVDIAPPSHPIYPFRQSSGLYDYMSIY